MGAYSWSRDNAGKGHTHVSGTPVVLPPPSSTAKHTGPPPAKRARVWKREDAAAGPSTSAAAAPLQQGGTAAGPAPSTAAGPAQQPAGQQPPRPPGAAQQHAQPQQPARAAERGGAARQGPPSAQRWLHHPGTSSSREATLVAGPAPPPSRLAVQESEAEALRQQILQKQAQLQQATAASKAAEAAEKNWRKQQRRQRLEAGFAQAFAEAKEAAAAEIAASKALLSFADESEVQRVLGAKSDYDVLKLQPGVDAGAVRRRYREMAVALHPDKCRAAQASEAFQRLVRAYQSLLAFAR